VTFRRRLTIAFVLAVGAGAAALAVGSYLVVRHNLRADSLHSAARQARRNLVIAPRYKSPDALLRAYEGGGFETVGVEDGQSFQSSFSVGLPAVPSELRQLVGQGRLAYQRRVVSGTHYLVVGGPAGQRTLYFFFSEEGLRHELIVLRNILVAGLAIVLLLAALTGALLARRTLRPVARASVAANSVAEGLLETRLPVEGRDEFGAWAQAFNEMAAALETKIAALNEAQARERRFTADVAHELRTPVTGLVGEASLLSEQLDGMPPASRRPAELLISDVSRLRRLVEELMEISRLDAGAEGVHEETVDVALLTAAIVRARDPDGRVQVDSESAVISTDRRRLERVVANLVGNALEHGGDGIVQVRVRPDGGGALVEVADHGPGIPPEHLPHLFERFYKADPARAGQGSGLGLAIARENARLVGGEIEVSSEPGRGARFTVRL
jgi:signal transduction histidine kinase